MIFHNKVVLVTGASSGIGAATAVLFAKEGASVSIVGRNETKLKHVSELIKNVGKEPLIIKADVSIDEEAKSIIDQTIAKFGKLDILINNAGILRFGSLDQGTSLAVYDELIKTNLRAVINITMLAVPHLKTTKGSIVNVSSIASQRVFSEEALEYSVTKAALDHFTRGSAMSLAKFGIRVNSVNPGPVVTDILDNIQHDYFSWDVMKESTLLKRVSQPEEVADLISFLASDKAKGITGSIHVVDNGMLLTSFTKE